MPALDKRDQDPPGWREIPVDPSTLADCTATQFDWQQIFADLDGEAQPAANDRNERARIAVTELLRFLADGFWTGKRPQKCKLASRALALIQVLAPQLLGRGTRALVEATRWSRLPYDIAEFRRLYGLPKPAVRIRRWSKRPTQEKENEG
jgi:hypothetical protein